MNATAVRFALVAALLAPAQAFAVGLPMPGGRAAATPIQYAPDNSVWVNGHQTSPYRSPVAPPAQVRGGGYSSGYANGYDNGYSNGAVSGYGGYGPYGGNNGSTAAGTYNGGSFNDKYGFSSVPR